MKPNNGIFPEEDQVDDQHFLHVWVVRRSGSDLKRWAAFSKYVYDARFQSSVAARWSVAVHFEGKNDIFCSGVPRQRRRPCARSVAGGKEDDLDRERVR